MTDTAPAASKALGYRKQAGRGCLQHLKANRKRAFHLSVVCCSNTRMPTEKRGIPQSLFYRLGKSSKNTELHLQSFTSKGVPSPSWKDNPFHTASQTWLLTTVSTQQSKTSRPQPDREGKWLPPLCQGQGLELHTRCPHHKSSPKHRQVVLSGLTKIVVDDTTLILNWDV